MNHNDSRQIRRHVARAAGAVAIVIALGACGGGGSGASVQEFCSGLKTVNAKADVFGGASLAPLGKSQLTTLANDMRGLAAKAPSDVKADVMTVAEFLKKASDHGMSSVDSATTDAANAAGERIATFANNKCGAPSDTTD